LTVAGGRGRPRFTSAGRDRGCSCGAAKTLTPCGPRVRRQTEVHRCWPSVRVAVLRVSTLLSAPAPFAEPDLSASP